MTDRKPKLSELTLVGFVVNSAIDSGHGSAISIDRVYSGIQNRTLFQDINQAIPGECDFSLLEQEQRSDGVFNALSASADSLEGRERRKVGVENSGLNLIIALVFEAIQQRNWQ